MKEVVIGCDNVAIALKGHLIQVLKEMQVDYEDVGVFTETDPEVYPNIGALVCRRIIESVYCKRGILICGTGIGMAITANKFPGIYAAVCHDIYSAQRARLSNDTNVLTMGARVVGAELAKVLVREWLSLEFKPGSSSPKLERLKEIETLEFKTGEIRML
jgi:ribose 5-phosphate isomerase B